MSNEFARHFVSALVRDAYSVVTSNHDWLRFHSGKVARLRYQLKDAMAALCHKLRLAPCRYDEEYLAFILKHESALSKLYNLLGDSYSRELMIKLLEYRVLGPRHIKLPRNTEEFWHKYTTVDQKYAFKMRTRSYWNRSWFLNRYRLPIGNETVTLDAHPLGILNTFLLEQYAYTRGEETIAVKNGDIVIDGGACLGDTALYFAAKAGNSGAVLSFEFVDENLSILKENFTQNVELARRVRLVTKALWNRAGETLSFDNKGPGTRVSSKPSGSFGTKVETTSIDRLALTEKLPKVDFIKLDIEGAELNALIGGREIIRKYKPNLAISLYHKKEDLITIAQWIQSLGLGYRFYLDHFTIHTEETVLFASAGR